jgi:hypothetical protein
VITELTSKLLAAGCKDREAIDLLKAAMVQARLERAGGNVCRAAREAETHRNTFSRWLKELGLERLPGIIREERRRGGVQMALWKKLPRSAPRMPEAVLQRRRAA